MRSDPANLLPFRASAASATVTTPDVLVGPSEAMARLWSQIRRVAPYFRAALLTGERGTGHAAVAQALHQLSPRAMSPFLELTAEDAEEQLTHATLPHFPNYTLFVPDIDRFSPPAQHGLLRLMRARRPKQTCIVAASTAELRPLVSAGAFSSVLASSLSGLHITLPALRTRAEDIPALATLLLSRQAQQLSVECPALSSEVLASLTEQPWPGNIEQLQSAMQHLLGEQLPADAAGLAAALDALPAQMASPQVPVNMVKLEEVVQTHIRSVLVACHGNKLRAAEVLGISRSTLYRMLDSGAAAGMELPFAS